MVMTKLAIAVMDITITTAADIRPASTAAWPSTRAPTIDIAEPTLSAFLFRLLLKFQRLIQGVKPRKRRERERLPAERQYRLKEERYYLLMKGSYSYIQRRNQQSYKD
jgi:hypothetical protein